MAYLSRLVRQTGLTAGAAQPSQLAGSVAMPALEVEEVIAAPSPAAPFTGPIAPPVPAEQPAEDTARLRAPGPAVAAPPDIAEPLNTPEASGPREPLPSRAPSHAPVLVEITELVEQRADVADLTPEPVAMRAATQHRNPVADTTRPPASMPSSPAEARARAFAERLAEVRAWVSATPALDELAEPAHASPVDAVAHAPMQSIDRARRTHADALNTVDAGVLAAGAPAEVNEFTLSIGTIQVVLDEPAPTSAAPTAPAGQAAAGEARLPMQSRLSRHYLRV